MEITAEETHIVRKNSVARATEIFAPSINIALIEREYPPILRAEFEQLNLHLRGEYRGVVRRSDMQGLADFVTPFCTSAITARLVFNEIQSVVEEFLNLTGQECGQMIFGQITSDHCRLFHDDKNHLRLLCTYTGKGTEWLHNEDVNRGGLGTGTNAGYISGRQIQQLRPYEIAILKGDLYPGNAGKGLVHRSPPMGAGDAPRLFLAIDSLGRKPFSGEEISWRKIEFPRRNIKKYKWRVAESGDGLFCREVKARFEESRRSLK